VLLLVVRFVAFDTDDYFALVAQPTLYVAWHVVLSVSDCDVHVQISTCFDWILLEH
jgi:hypothetical protein